MTQISLSSCTFSTSTVTVWLVHSIKTQESVSVSVLAQLQWVKIIFYWKWMQENKLIPKVLLTFFLPLCVYDCSSCGKKVYSAHCLWKCKLKTGFYLKMPSLELGFRMRRWKVQIFYRELNTAAPICSWSRLTNELFSSFSPKDFLTSQSFFSVYLSETTFAKNTQSNTSQPLSSPSSKHDLQK